MEITTIGGNTVTILEAAEQSLQKWISYSKGEITEDEGCGMCDYHYVESEPCPLAMEAHGCDCDEIDIDGVCIKPFSQ